MKHNKNRILNKYEINTVNIDTEIRNNIIKSSINIMYRESYIESEEYLKLLDIERKKFTMVFYEENKDIYFLHITHEIIDILCLSDDTTSIPSPNIFFRSGGNLFITLGDPDYLTLDLGLN